MNRPLKNQEFGDLRVTAESYYKHGTRFWICRCGCGGMRIVEEKRLMALKVAMCVGCEVRRKMELWEDLTYN